MFASQLQGHCSWFHHHNVAGRAPRIGLKKAPKDEFTSNDEDNVEKLMRGFEDIGGIKRLPLKHIRLKCENGEHVILGTGGFGRVSLTSFQQMKHRGQGVSFAEDCIQGFIRQKVPTLAMGLQLEKVWYKATPGQYDLKLLFLYFAILGSKLNSWAYSCQDLCESCAPKLGFLKSWLMTNNKYTVSCRYIWEACTKKSAPSKSFFKAIEGSKPVFSRRSKFWRCWNANISQPTKDMEYALKVCACSWNTFQVGQLYEQAKSTEGTPANLWSLLSCIKKNCFLCTVDWQAFVDQPWNCLSAVCCNCPNKMHLIRAS